MRLRPRALGVYLGSPLVHFNEPMNPFTMAPGPSLGEYIAGKNVHFNEPQNPFAQGSTGLSGLGAGVPVCPAGDTTKEISGQPYCCSPPEIWTDPNGAFGTGMVQCTPALRKVSPVTVASPHKVPLRGMGCLGCLGQTSSDLTIGGVDLTTMWNQISSYTVGGIPVVYLAGGGLLLLYLMRSQASSVISKHAAKLSNKARYLKGKVAAREAA